jgi:hypothetical protein
MILTVPLLIVKAINHDYEASYLGCFKLQYYILQKQINISGMKRLTIILISVITLSCNNKIDIVKNDNLHIIDLSKIDLSKNIKVSELFSDVTPIVLETTNESLIGHISKMVTTPNHIIIMDNIISNSLFVFDKNGYYLHKIGMIGTGPGEYVSISDFCFDMYNTIYLLDFQSQNINQYELDSGKFIKTIKLKNEDGMSWFIGYNNDQFYTNMGLFKQKNKNILNQRNSTTGIVNHSWFDLEIYSKGIDFISNNSKSPFLFSNDNTLKFKAFFMDTIMMIDNNQIKPFLTFTPEYCLNKKDVESIDFAKTDSFTKLSKKNKIYDLFTYIEHNDLLILQFFLGIDVRTIIYNQKEKSIVSVNFFIDDIIYKKDIDHLTFPKFLNFDENGIFAWLDYNEMVLLKKDFEAGFLSDKFNESINYNNINEDSNPMILYYEFKK